MVRGSLALPFVVALLGSACGPSVGGEPMLAEPELHDALAERCGSTDPIQLLALSPSETVETGDPWYPGGGKGYTSVARHRERWLLGVKTFEHEFVPPSLDPEENVPNPLVSSRIVSVDGCGGDVQVVLEGAHAMRVPTGDEPWVACSDAQAMIAFDPDGGGSGTPHPELRCSTDVVDGAFVAITHEDEDGVQWLARARLAVDGPSDVTLLAPDAYEPHVVEGASRRLFTRDGEIVEIDVLTGQERVLRMDVYDWSASADGRFVEWRPVHDGCGPVLLWDRQLDEERPLGPPEWDCVQTFGIDGDAAAVTPRENEPDLTQLVLFATGDEIVLDGHWRSLGRVGQTYVLHGSGEVPSLVLVAPGAEPSPPIRVGLGSWRIVELEDDGLRMLVDEAEGADGMPPSSRALYELAAPDFTPRLVAAGVWHPLRLADGRVLDVRARDLEHQRGTLVLVDGEQGSVELDRDVAEALYALNTEGLRDLLAPLVDDTVVYGVRDPEHERTGVWVAQIAPRVER